MNVPLSMATIEAWNALAGMLEMSPYDVLWCTGGDDPDGFGGPRHRMVFRCVGHSIQQNVDGHPDGWTMVDEYGVILLRRMPEDAFTDMTREGKVVVM